MQVTAATKSIVLLNLCYCILCALNSGQGAIRGAGRGAIRGAGRGAIRGTGRGAVRGAGRGRMRGFGRRGRGGRGAAPTLTKDELDAQLDAYNAKVCSHLFEEKRYWHSRTTKVLTLENYFRGCKNPFP